MQNSEAPLFFPYVTLLVTHYNRSQSLERLLPAFQKQNIRFGDMVVSDDGSQPEHQHALQKLQQQYAFRLVTTPKNRGLGHNINKGQEAVTTPYTLYVQEDFVPKPAFKKAFNDALNIMQNQPGIDIIRFYAYFNYPYTKPFANGFSEMIFHPAPWYANHLKFYLYSDHPHLRRSNFLQKFGRYPEGIKGDATEFSMALSLLKKGARGLLYNSFTDVFDQANSSAEPSTMERSQWRQRTNPAVLALRRLYLPLRLLKNTWQYLTFKPQQP